MIPSDSFKNCRFTRSSWRCRTSNLSRRGIETEAALELYTDLYEFAPSGYFTLDRDGTIRQVNLTGSGSARGGPIAVGEPSFWAFRGREFPFGLSGFRGEGVCESSARNLRSDAPERGKTPVLRSHRGEKLRQWPGVPRRGGGHHRAQTVRRENPGASQPARTRA